MRPAPAPATAPSAGYPPSGTTLSPTGADRGVGASGGEQGADGGAPAGTGGGAARAGQGAGGEQGADAAAASKLLHEMHISLQLVEGLHGQVTRTFRP